MFSVNDTKFRVQLIDATVRNSMHFRSHSLVLSFCLL